MGESEVRRIRSATEADAAALLDIYRPHVERTAVSFETVVPSVEEFAGRIRKALSGWTWLVMEVDGECVGYAYGSAHRERAGYHWSVEVSAYVREDQHRRGVARALYTRLFDDLREKGYCNAYAGITLPNDASVGLHRSLGFEPIGVFTAVGRKLGRWQDVGWFQKKLRDEPPFEP